ncbi:hypothetical protein X975_17597, partial [Stegodyphus mimosarum]
MQPNLQTIRRQVKKFKVLDEKVTKDSNKDDSSYSMDVAISPLEMLAEVCSTRYEVHSESALLSEQDMQSNFHKCKNSTSSQTKLVSRKLCILPKKVRALQKALRACKLKVKSLKQENEAMKKLVQKYENNFKTYNIHKIKHDAESNNLKAIFLLEQMSTFGKKRKAWNDIVLRYCVIWHSQSPRGYRLVR